MYIYGNTWFGDPFLGEIRISLRNSTASGLNLTRAQLVLEILMVLMCVGAVAGNILVIVIVAATKTFHSVTSVLIINLAISDFLVGIGVMPFVAVSIMNNEWVNCTDLCLYVGYTSSVYCTASVLTLAAIALDRYYCIVDCLHYDTRCTAWRTGAVVLWIWLQAVVTSCPPLLGWSSVSFMGPMYSCTVNWASSPSYTALMAVLSFLLPGAVILFCYVKIVRVARSHAKRIHSLEEHIQRGRGSSSTSSFSPSSSPPSRGARRSTSPDSGSSSHSASRLVYYVSGRFVSEARVEGPGSGGPPMDSTGPQGGENSSSQHLHSFFAHLQSSGPQRSPQRTPQRTPQPAPQARPHSQSQQSQLQHNGLLRLFMVIAAFFLCWTPYICVALVQATETALSRPATQVPPTAVTFSFWLLLFNSDLNPLLYALLSKRFQGALWSLRQKVQARLGRIVGRGNEERLNEGVRRESNPSNHTAPHPASQSSNDTSSQEGASYSSVLSLNSHFPSGYKEQLGDVLLPRGMATSSCSLWPACGETAPRSLDCLQVPSLPKEGGRLPYSAASKERQATFFYGQITVRVEHDMC